MGAEILPLMRSRRVELPVRHRDVRIRLSAEATATLLAFVKDEDRDLSQALSFIIADWAALKRAALAAARPVGVDDGERGA